VIYHSPSCCPSQHHVTSTSCSHTATALHLLIILALPFFRLWGETRSKYPSFTSGNFHVTIPLHDLQRPLYMYMLQAQGPGQKCALSYPTHWQSTLTSSLHPSNIGLWWQCFALLHYIYRLGPHKSNVASLSIKKVIEILPGVNPIFCSDNQCSVLVPLTERCSIC
jgi:hypothetical protein